MDEKVRDRLYMRGCLSERVCERYVRRGVRESYKNENIIKIAQKVNQNISSQSNNQTIKQTTFCTHRQQSLRFILRLSLHMIEQSFKFIFIFSIPIV